jgi:hypothetical protein
MANEVRWSALGSYTTAISGTSLTPTLKNLSAAARVLGNEIDNTQAPPTARNTLSEWDLLVRFASAPATGAYLSLYFMQAVDGTNYQDGDASTAPPQSAWVGNFLARAVATSQRIALSGVRLPPTKFKPLIVNNGSTGLTNTDGDNILSFVTYNPEVQ